MCRSLRHLPPSDITINPFLGIRDEVSEFPFVIPQNVKILQCPTRRHGSERLRQNDGQLGDETPQHEKRPTRRQADPQSTEGSTFPDKIGMTYSSPGDIDTEASKAVCLVNFGSAPSRSLCPLCTSQTCSPYKTKWTNC